MALKRKILTGVDIALIVGIVIFSMAGVVYAGVSGVIKIPVLDALLNADSNPTGAPSKIVINIPSVPPVSPSPSSAAGTVDSSPSPAGGMSPAPVSSPSSAAITPTPAASPKVSPSPVKASPAASPVVSPKASPATSPSPSVDSAAAKTKRDDQRKKDLATIQTYLKLYHDKHKIYPASDYFRGSRTDRPTTPLQPLVTEKFAPSLPVDPRHDAPISDDNFWYGYRSDTNTYQLTAQLENKADPAGAYDVDHIYLYVVNSQ